MGYSAVGTHHGVIRKPDVIGEKISHLQRIEGKKQKKETKVRGYPYICGFGH